MTLLRSVSVDARAARGAGATPGASGWCWWPACPFGRRDGAAALRRLLARPRPPDAVFAYNDLIAMGVLRAALESGVAVPDDLAVIGFDDIEERRYGNPSLTTIAPDKHRIGTAAVGCLIGRLNGSRTVAPEEVEVPFSLVVRESTVGRPRQQDPPADAGAAAGRRAVPQR